jgi:Protein of unknown function (DUF4038)/Putative collagen-binding domain of a collagenase
MLQVATQHVASNQRPLQGGRRRNAPFAAACALVCAGSLVALTACATGTQAGTKVHRAEPAKRVRAVPDPYPLKAGPTRRYLVDQRNRPFFIVGDSPQSLIVNLSPRQANAFLADRSAYGFNAMWMNLLCDTYTGGRSDGSTYDGIRPFRVQGNLSTPNPPYFARADRMIRLAAKYGITVFLDPIETGGWLDVLRANRVAKAFRYGRYLGRRYRSFANIVWMSGNDFKQASDPSDDALALAVARGIKSSDRRHIQTVELSPPELSGSLDDPRWRAVIGLDAAYAYTYAPPYAYVLKEYARRDFLPVFMVEANYEGENAYRGPETLRRQEYWTLLSGATGQFYGNTYTWPFKSGWQSHVDTVGSRQMTYVTHLFAGRPWFQLTPDRAHKVLIGGYGTYLTTGNVNDSDYATAARTRDGRLVIAYLPTIRTVAIDMTKLSGRVRAQWYDPSAGRYVRVSGSPFRNAGTRKFTPPGRNADGDGDWVLVLTAT